LRARCSRFSTNWPADRARVEIIVTNLIENAIKYSPRGGHIDCTVEVRGGDALVAVTDHGIGIATGDMTTLFTRIGRITSDATISIPGTGLGLHVSREAPLPGQVRGHAGPTGRQRPRLDGPLTRSEGTQ
jgi:signal transduction histidine kinase